MRERVQMYLMKERAAYAAKEAKAQEMTLSSFCSRIVNDVLGEMMENSPHGNDENNEDEGETIHVRVRGKAGKLLRKKATELGLTPTEWVHEAALTKNFILYTIELDDLGEMNTELDRLVSEIEGIGAAIRKNKKASKQDMELILERMDAILDVFRLHFSSTIDRRKKEQKRLEKKGTW